MHECLHNLCVTILTPGPGGCREPEERILSKKAISLKYRNNQKTKSNPQTVEVVAKKSVGWRNEEMPNKSGWVVDHISQ